MRPFISLLFFASLASPLVLAASPDPREEVLQAQRAKAEVMREEAKLIRQKASSAREKADAACLAKFLVNDCQIKARENYLAEIKIAREKEIEASRIETEVRAGQGILNQAKREAKDQAEAAKQATRPSPKPAPEPKLPPPAVAAPENQAKFEAGKAQRRQEADKRRAEAAQEASLRAEQRRKDAARYEARAKIIAERKAKRTEKSAGKAGVQSGSASSLLKP